MKVSFPSLVQMTAFFENTIVSVLFFGCEILTNMQPTIKASTIDPRIDCTISSRIASGHLSVITLVP